MAHDGDLVRNVQAGDREAMEALVRRHYELVYAYIQRYTGDRQVAKDLTQDVFVKVTLSIHRFRMRSDFRSWLLTIATNQCRDYFRRSAARAPTVPVHEDVDRLVDERGNVADIFERDERLQQVKRALSGLPGAEREVLVLRFFHDLSIKDIARVTSANDSTVKSRLRRGILKLKQWLHGEEGHDERTQYGG